MKAKSFLSLVLLLLIVGSLWFFFKKSGDSITNENREIGVYLFSNLPVDLIGSVSMKDGDHSVTLIKENDSWIIAEKGYHANLDKMRNIVSELRDAKIWKVIKATDEVRQRLNLMDPSSAEATDDKKATHLVVTKENGEIIVDMFVGSFRVSPEGRAGGRYIIKKGQSEVVNIDMSLGFIDTLPQNWLNKKLVDIKSKMIKKFSVFSIDGMEIFSFERSEGNGDFEPVIFPEDKEPDNEKLTRLTESLENLTLIDVLPASNIDINFGNYLSFELSDGAICKIYPITADDKKIIKIEFFPNELKEEEEADGTINGMELQSRFAQWLFIVPTWTYEAFITNAEGLFEEEEN